MKIRKSWVWLIAFVVAFSILFTGCTSTPSTSNDDTKQTLIKDDTQKSTFTQEPTDIQGPQNSFDILNVPEYSDKAYIIINNNQPEFSKDDIKKEAYEFYSPLDSLGRCGYVMACVCKETMPTEPRGSISHINPTGWNNQSYEIVEGGYLYNRCHLIGWQLTGEDANKSNLITGTRYMNMEGMLPFENMIADYVTETGNHVMYRVTPIFEGDNLLASGVHLEGYSVEDNGGDDGISFNVYVYNVQPGIILDYTTGANQLGQLPEGTDGAGDSTAYAYVINKSSGTVHLPECASAKSIKQENRIESNDSLADLLKEGYKACGKCNPT